MRLKNGETGSFFLLSIYKNCIKLFLKTTPNALCKLFNTFIGYWLNGKWHLHK
ncbi:hypothetical protein [Butyrivibrio fibrisolvens]|uniref:hypothetical protein n=1 Tax=Butyrivibrio fibrisolvens TaxID=831 RepID=UPI0015A6CF34|nr:hypothetical protein [Butyrivibrio fibrisolvens]